MPIDTDAFTSVVKSMASAATQGDLWDDNYFGCILPDGPRTIQPAYGRALLDALDVAPTLRRDDPANSLSPYEQELQAAWNSDKPILPLGLWVLWGTKEVGKSEVLRRVNAKTKDIDGACISIYDVGDVNSKHPAPIGNATMFTKFLDKMIEQKDADRPSGRSDATLVLVDSISWYDDINVIANASARRNAVPKQWEEYLKAFHRWAVSKNVILIATMNPNDTWENSLAEQIQAFESSIGFFGQVGNGKFAIRYGVKDAQEPRLHGEFDVAWRSAHGVATTASTAGILRDYVSGVPMEPAIPSEF